MNNVRIKSKRETKENKLVPHQPTSSLYGEAIFAFICKIIINSQNYYCRKLFLIRYLLVVIQLHDRIDS